MPHRTCAHLIFIVGALTCYREDDGVVLSVVLDSFHSTSFLLVLDAQSFEEIARVTVPNNHIVPLGFHGRYYNNATPWT